MLAGANIRRKTSLIDLLRVTIKAGSAFGFEDFNATKRYIWSQEIFAAFIEVDEKIKEVLSEGNLKQNSPRSKSIFK